MTNGQRIGSTCGCMCTPYKKGATNTQWRLQVVTACHSATSTASGICGGPQSGACTIVHGEKSILGLTTLLVCAKVSCMGSMSGICNWVSLYAGNSATHTIMQHGQQDNMG